MGMYRGYVDADGNERLLEGHEGTIQARVFGEGDHVVGDELTGFWTSNHDPDTPELTGQYRAVCECGWVGGILDATKQERWPSSSFVSNGSWSPWLRDDINEAILRPWGSHVDAMILEEMGLDVLDTVEAASAQLVDAIATARCTGIDWSDIARRVGLNTTELRAHYEANSGEIQIR